MTGTTIMADPCEICGLPLAGRSPKYCSPECSRTGATRLRKLKYAKRHGGLE